MEPECQHLDDGELLKTPSIAFCSERGVVIRSNAKMGDDVRVTILSPKYSRSSTPLSIIDLALPHEVAAVWTWKAYNHEQ